jgi:hypothetical protein
MQKIGFSIDKPNDDEGEEMNNWMISDEKQSEIKGSSKTASFNEVGYLYQYIKYQYYIATTYIH